MDDAAAGISEILKRAACESLENLAFTEVSPRGESRLEAAQDRYAGSRIGLGTMGTLDLVIGRDLLEEIATVLFNPPDGLSPEVLLDTQMEILNIIAGRFLEGVFRETSDFALGLPESHLDIGEWNSLPVRWVLVAEDGKELAVGMNPALAVG